VARACVADLARIDHGDGQTGDAELGHQRGFIPPSGLDHDQPRANRLQPRDDVGDPGGIIGPMPLCAARADREV
jgi:hypothetical protein